MRAFDGDKLVIASHNAGKLREISALLTPFGITCASAADFNLDEPEETESTFAGNARIKAHFAAKGAGLPALSDDSGIAVDALDGAPGVHSARYAGAEGDRPARDAANNAKLLAALADVPDDRRSARFVCCMCLAEADGTIVAETRGTFDGVITSDPAGTNGFGYDPLLYLPDSGCTSAQLTPEAKNARSHRGKACRLLADLLS